MMKEYLTPGCQPGAVKPTLEQHVKAVGDFLTELGETMGVVWETDETVIRVTDMCRLLLERARADREAAVIICPLRLQLVDPGKLTCLHQEASNPERRYAIVQFAFQGPEALVRSEQLHDALLALIRMVQNPPRYVVDADLLRLAVARFGFDMCELDESCIIDRYSYEAADPGWAFDRKKLKQMILDGTYKSAAET